MVCAPSSPCVLLYCVSHDSKEIVGDESSSQSRQLHSNSKDTVQSSGLVYASLPSLGPTFAGELRFPTPSIRNS